MRTLHLVFSTNTAKHKIHSVYFSKLNAFRVSSRLRIVNPDNACFAQQNQPKTQPCKSP